MVEIKELNFSERNFWEEMDALLAWDSVSDDQVFTTVNAILADIKKRGDVALIEYTRNMITAFAYL